MRKITVTFFLLIGAVSMGLSWVAYRAAATPEAEVPLSRYVPSGALLYLQAKDFSTLLADWNKMVEKGKLPKGDSAEGLSSKELERLKSLGYVQ